MTSAPTPVPPNEEEMGPHLARLGKPFVLAAPLMVAALLPAAFYGQRSRDVAAEANRALVDSFTPTGGGSAVVLDSEAFCKPSDAATTATTFNEIDIGGDNHKSSVNGLGFDTVTVDLEGWVDEPSGQDKDRDRDSITFLLERSDGAWCVAEVKSLIAEST